MKQTFRARIRTFLTVCRLVVLYGLFCIGVFFTALAIQSPSLDHAQPAHAESESAGQTQSATLGITVEWDGLPAAERRAALQRLHDIGFRWIRLRVGWDGIEPMAGVYDWTFFDAALDDITKLGLDPVVVLDGSPSWARARQDQAPHGQTTAPPAHVSTFAGFASAFAQRYADRVRYYQIWDEPNIAPHWGNQHIEPVAYAQLLDAAAHAIRAADPDAFIISAALAPTLDRGHTAIDEIYFLQRLYAAGAAADWDAIAIQPFGFGYSPTMSPPHPDRLNFQRATLVRQVMVAAGDAETPVWAVRFGWNIRADSPWRTVTNANQQRYTRLALDFVNAQWPWMPAIGWAVDRPLAPASDPQWGFALSPQLGAIFFDRISQPIPTPDQRLPTTPVHLSIWTLLTGATVVGWRAHAAILQLRPSEVVGRLSSLPSTGYWSLWLVLAAVYYLATWPPLILICCLGAVVLLLAKPRAGLWLIAACLPFYYQHKAIRIVHFAWYVPPAHLLALCMLPATVSTWRSAARQRRIQWDRWLALAAAWLAISGLSSVNVWYWPGYTTGMLDLVLIPLLLYMFVRIHCRDSRDLVGVALAAIGGGVAVALIGLGSWFAGSGTVADGMRRLVGPHFSPNHTALYLVRCLTLAIGLAVASRPPASRRLLIAACIFLTPALLLTGSRGALLLGLPAGIVFLLFVHFGQWRKHYLTLRPIPPTRNIRTWIFGVVVALSVFGLTLYLMGDRLANSATIQARLAIWRHALDLWRDYPLFGVGPGGFFWRFPAYIPPDSALDPNLQHPHNLAIEYATMWGAAGLAWLLIAIVLTVEHLRRHKFPTPSIAIAATAALVAAAAHAQVDAFATLPDIAAWNWLALALLTYAPATASSSID